MAIAISVAPLLIATPTNAPFFTIMSASLMAYFTSVGWIDLNDMVLGLLLLLGAAGFVITRGSKE